MKSTIQEYDLLNFCLCPARLNESVTYLRSEFGPKSVSAFSTILLNAFNGDTSLHSIHTCLDSIKEFGFGKKAKTEADEAYQAKVKVAKSLATLFRRMNVVLPVAKYQLKIGATSVVGEYAVLQDKENGNNTVFRLRGSETYGVMVDDIIPPDVISCARLTHISLDPVIIHPGITTFHLPTGIVRNHFPSLTNCWNAVHSAVYQYESNRVHYQPGIHCRTCETKACL